MTNTDCNFPIIKYNTQISSIDNGKVHGESFRPQIIELFNIRKDLMLQKNPLLQNKLKELSTLQIKASEKLAPHLIKELQGIAEGSKLQIEDIVLLNNYTDFRDIQLPEEGCSTIAISDSNNISCGQTWDMHGSAKKYVSVIEVEDNQGITQVVFSLVGCLGMMGFTNKGCFVGVNNINTQNAKAGVIWPLLVRHLLNQKNAKEMYQLLKEKPVTSGHNYLISDPKQSFHLEVSPSFFEETDTLKRDEIKQIFHTNHCLGTNTKSIEISNMLSSTTHNRMNILQKNSDKLKSYNDLRNILTSHEEYPKSICSHFESGAQDPSFTCGGGIVNMDNFNCNLWRGCPTEDKNFVEYKYQFDGKYFSKS